LRLAGSNSAFLSCEERNALGSKALAKSADFAGPAKPSVLLEKKRVCFAAHKNPDALESPAVGV